MRNNFFIKACFCTLVLLYASEMKAQNRSKSLNYNKHAYWIEMMNDPNVNYFEAVKAYDEFWATRKKPAEENEIIGESISPKEKHRLFKTRGQKEEEEVRKYALDVKKFEHWKFMVKPYVQEDGHILNADEQLKIWKQQKQH